MPKSRNKKAIPDFSVEVDERSFWSESDSTDHVDWSQARRAVFPNLRPSLQTISIRLPVHMIEEIKMLARKRDVPYQSLMKMILAESLKKEWESK